jgi:protocatechuate 3,4-dioxygenase beta subunit
MARERLVAEFDMGTTIDNWAHGFVWDIVLRGREATPTEDHHHHD